MKKVLGCRVGILVILGWLLLSAIGYMGKNSIYRDYVLDVRTMPYFELVLLGIHDGIYPWSPVPEDPAQDSAGEMKAVDQPEVQPQQEFVQVDESYFDDAVFIGDSRTVGLMEYGNLENATFCANVGMNIRDLWKKEFCEIDGEKATLEQVLTSRQFGKIYFQIGINEMGWATVDLFMEEYAQTIQKFRELQPDAVIFIQGILRVSKLKSESDPVFNNQGINERNERIAQLADNVHVFYIDVNEAVCDEEGNLEASFTSDGLHLYAEDFIYWVEYLKSKGIEKR